MTIASGTRLGPYEIVARIRAGKMGEVYRARDTRLGRDVAIKILPPEFAQNAKLKDRFEREAKAIEHLSHPNICTLFDVGENYIVMELLEGESLADRLTKGPLPLSDVLKYGVQIADALDRAHRAGIVHRDLKPGNIMLAKGGAKLLDFGLAKNVLITAASDGSTPERLTSEGVILGTLSYITPEQLGGEGADARTDIFALGATLYEMATGSRAFEGETRTSLIRAIMSGESKPMSELLPLVPPELEHVVKKSLAKKPEERWQRASDIANELRSIAAAVSKPDVSAPPTKERRIPDQPQPDQPQIMTIYYATDRRRSGNNTPARFYGGNRGAETLEFGQCRVSVPTDRRLRKIGQLTGPSFLERETSILHVLLLDVLPSSRDTWVSALRSSVEASLAGGVLVFIHGYNVSFRDAARRTAQLAYDLQYDGAPVLYSWPSKGHWWRYLADEATIEWTEPHLRDFLKLIASESGAKTIHVVAHSMGNRALARAAAQLPPSRVLRQLILTAPDIDTDVFLQLASQIASAANRVTLYASSRDRALLLSKLFHVYPRAGQSGDRLVVTGGIDTIDATTVDTSLVGHSYFADNRSILSDLYSLILNELPPPKRFGLRERRRELLVYWEYQP